MKNVLCFGDSLTWGTDPSTSVRYARHERWPAVMGEKIGAGRVHVIEEALGGRTTAFDDHTAAADRNAARILPTLLASHQPLDLVVILLGTNDLKPHISGSPGAAASGVKRLIEIVRTFPYLDGTSTPQILVVAPPHIVPTQHPFLGPMFAGAAQMGSELAAHLARICQELNCAFFDAGPHASASAVDGVHLDKTQTHLLGRALAAPIAKLLELEIEDERVNP